MVCSQLDSIPSRDEHERGLVCSWIGEKLKALRAKYREARNELTLWQRPFATLSHFIQELVVLLQSLVSW
jgi:hypothetical protein